MLNIKSFLLLLCLCFAAMPAIAQDGLDAQPLPRSQGEEPTTRTIPPPTINLYGKMSCVWTTAYITELKKARIPFTFYDLNNPANVQKMNKALRSARQDTTTVYMPAVEMYGKAYARPNLKAFIASAKQAFRAAQGTAAQR